MKGRWGEYRQKEEKELGFFTPSYQQKEDPSTKAEGVSDGGNNTCYSCSKTMCNPERRIRFGSSSQGTH